MKKYFILVFIIFFLFSCMKNIEKIDFWSSESKASWLIEKINSWSLEDTEKNLENILWFVSWNTEYNSKNIEELKNILKNLEKNSEKIDFFAFYEWKVNLEETLEILGILKWFENESIRFNIPNINDKIFKKLAEFKAKNLQIFLSDVSKVDEEIEIPKKIWEKYLENETIDLVLFDTIAGKNFILIDENLEKINVIYDSKKAKIFSDIYNIEAKSDKKVSELYKNRVEKYFWKDKILWVE